MKYRVLGFIMGLIIAVPFALLILSGRCNTSKHLSKPDSLIDLSIIKQIESGGNPLAFNKRSGARGLYKITGVVLDNYNEHTIIRTYHNRDLFGPVLNEKIACWYIRKRIPQRLGRYGFPVTVENVLISWKEGIAYVVEQRELPRETVDFIAKYKRLGQNDRTYSSLPRDD